VHFLDDVVRFTPARRCGVRLLESCLIAFGFFSNSADSEDGVRAGGRLPIFTLSIFRWHSGSRPGKLFIVANIEYQSTLMHFEQHIGDGSRPSPESGSLIEQAVVAHEFERSHGRVR
jgi:hypothetical protein